MAATATQRSIRTRLACLVLASLGVSFVALIGLSLWHEAGRYLQAKRDTLLATAHVFAAASSHAAAGKDAQAVMQGMRAIARVPGLIRAEVEDLSGQPIAGIGSAIRLDNDLNLTDASASPFALLGTRTVAVTVPVIEGGESVARLTLVSDTSDLPAQFRTVVLQSLVGAIVPTLLGLLLAGRLQGSLTAPLTSLTAAMTEIEKTRVFAPVTIVAGDLETARLATAFNAMITEINQATNELLERETEIIDRLSRAGELRDDQTGQHVARVAKISRIIAQDLGLARDFVDDLCRASPMHDVGKISIPDAILHKPGRLDADERREMERHAERGYRILSGSRSKLVQLAAEIAISHHERWDGDGYPYRLAGDRIPLSGRITAVADVCDALLSERPYKRPWSLAQVRSFVVENAGRHFDPACVVALLRHWPELEAVYGEQPTPEAAAA